MESWVRRSGTSTDTSKSSTSKGKGKGKISDRSGQQPFRKFQRTEVDLLQHVAEQSSLGIEIGLENRCLIGILLAQASMAAIAPKNKAF